jgi:hypothetical protein
MIASLIAFALLAGADSSSSSAKPNKSDPARMICRYIGEPGSRLQRRKVCQTAAEWAEQRRLDQQYLRQNQRNGAQ